MSAVLSAADAGSRTERRGNEQAEERERKRQLRHGDQLG